MRLFSSRRALVRAQVRHMCGFFIAMGVLSLLFAFLLTARLLLSW
jgi:hypothetical protein